MNMVNKVVYTHDMDTDKEKNTTGGFFMGHKR